MVEGAPFRVYSRTWSEGETGWVFIDEDVNNPPGELMYSGIVQPGGYIQITPDPLDLPAIGAPWFVSVATESDGSGRSTWINALNVVTAGDAVTPHVVTNEEDTSCGGAGTECTHEIIPGQTWQGEWGEAGDEDGFGFLAAAGTEVSITLDRVDLTLPPQHPDAPAPEIHLAGPDGIITAVSEPLALDATGTSLDATITVGGQQTILVRTSKGFGQYLVTLDVTAEGGTGEPAFGFTPERVYLTTEARPDVTLVTPLLDPFGNPITGGVVSWEQGTDCGMGSFCGNGTTTSTRSSSGGFALLDVSTAPGSAPLWKPTTTLAPMLKHMPLDRDGVDMRIARARAARPVLGRIETSGRALISTQLVAPTTAVELTAQAKQRAAIRGDAFLKDGAGCNNHTESCPNDGELVFRAAQLALDPGDELVDVEIRVLDGVTTTEKLDGYTILEPIQLSLEIEATVRDDQGVERQVMLTEPAGVVLSQGSGGALSDGAATCSELEITPGPAGFTYLNARDAAMHLSHTEPDGSPCCYQPTEYLEALVVIDAEVDDGQGGTQPVTKRASTVVESVPRPAEPCELRPWPPGVAGGTPLVAGSGSHTLDPGQTSTFDWVFSAYAIDACGNRNLLEPTDPGITATLLSPADPEVWAEAVQTEHFWEWNVLLRSTHCLDPPCDPATDSYYVPDGLYDIQLSTPSACGGTATYDQSIDLAAERPRIRLVWEQSGSEPEPPMASPGSALRNPNTGEVIAWRIKPTDHPYGDQPGETVYTDVPVRLYVAAPTISFDADGNVVESYAKVDDAEICVGEVHWHYDPDAYPDPSWDVRTTTCDQLFTGETTVLAYTEPEQPSGAFDGVIGVAAGVTKAPDQGGSYVLVAEPLDEAFRRGDAWRIETNVRMTVGESYSNGGTSKKEFLVGGGVFLDEGYVPITSELLIDPPTTVYYQYSTDVQGDTQREIEIIAEGELSYVSTAVFTPVSTGKLIGELQLDGWSLACNDGTCTGNQLFLEPGSLILNARAPQNPPGLKQGESGSSAAEGTVSIFHPIEPEFVGLGELSSDDDRMLQLNICQFEGSLCPRDPQGNQVFKSSIQQVPGGMPIEISLGGQLRNPQSVFLYFYPEFDDNPPAFFDSSTSTMNLDRCKEFEFTGPSVSYDDVNDLYRANPDENGLVTAEFKIKNLRDGDIHPVCAGQNIVISSKASGGDPEASKHPTRSSNTLTTYKSLYIEVVDSYKTGVFLAEDAVQGSNKVTLHFPANEYGVHPIEDLAEKIKCTLGDRNEDPPKIWFDCINTRPFVAFFDKVLRPESPIADQAYISRLEYTLSMLSGHKVHAYLVDENGDDYYLARFEGYKAGWDSDSNEAAAITTCTSGISPCQTDVFSFFSSDTGTQNESDLQSEADLVFGHAFTIPQIFHPGRAMPSLFPTHLKRDDFNFIDFLKMRLMYCNNCTRSENSYMTQVIAVDAHPYAAPSGIGFSDREFNYTIIEAGYLGTQGYTKEKMFTVFFHEVVHQFGINGCDGGDHCAETSIDYLPQADPAHSQDCIMHYPSTPEMFDSQHKFLGMACLYSSSCPISSEPYSIRNFDEYILKGEWTQ